jgi:hypothetical protein
LQNLVSSGVDIPAWNQSNLVSRNLIDLIEVSEEWETKDPCLLGGWEDLETCKEDFVTSINGFPVLFNDDG